MGNVARCRRTRVAGSVLYARPQPAWTENKKAETFSQYSQLQRLKSQVKATVRVRQQGRLRLLEIQADKHEASHASCGPSDFRLLPELCLDDSSSPDTTSSAG